MEATKLRENLVKALAPKKLFFELTIKDIPTVNLRAQYANDRKVVLTEFLAESLHAWKFGKGNVTVTYGDPDSYFTMLLRTTIVGIECTLQNLTLEELLFTNRLTEDVRRSIRKPPTRSMVDSYYNLIPRFVSPDAPLKTYDGVLWRTVEQFYREIRNPIFHGSQLTNVNAETLRGVFDMFDAIFK